MVSRPQPQGSGEARASNAARPMFDLGGFEPRLSASTKRRFRIEVDHDSQGVLPKAITIQMPKPPRVGDQIPSSQLRRVPKREFETSRGSQDRGPSSLVPEMAHWIRLFKEEKMTRREAHRKGQDCSKLLRSNILGE